MGTQGEFKEYQNTSSYSSIYSVAYPPPPDSILITDTIAHTGQWREVQILSASVFTDFSGSMGGTVGTTANVTLFGGQLHTALASRAPGAFASGAIYELIVPASSFSSSLTQYETQFVITAFTSASAVQTITALPASFAHVGSNYRFYFSSSLAMTPGRTTLFLSGSNTLSIVSGTGEVSNDPTLSSFIAAGTLYKLVVPSMSLSSSMIDYLPQIILSSSFLSASTMVPITNIYPDFFGQQGTSYQFFLTAAVGTTGKYAANTSGTASFAVWSDVSNDAALSASVARGQIYKHIVTASAFTNALPQYISQYVVTSFASSSTARTIVSQYPAYFTTDGQTYTFYLSASSGMMAATASVRGDSLRLALWSEIGNDAGLSASMARREIYQYSFPFTALSGSQPQYINQFTLSSSFTSASSAVVPIVAQYPTYTALSGSTYLFYVSASSTATNFRQVIRGAEVSLASWSDINNDAGLSASAAHGDIYKMVVLNSSLSGSIPRYVANFDTSASFNSASTVIPVVAQYPTYFAANGTTNYVFYLSASSGTTTVRQIVSSGSVIRLATWSDINNDSSLSASVSNREVYKLTVPATSLSGSLSQWVSKFDVSSSIYSASTLIPVVAQYPWYFTAVGTDYQFYLSASSTLTNLRQVVRGADARLAVWSDVRNDPGLSASIAQREIYKFALSASWLSGSLVEYLPLFEVSTSIYSSSTVVPVVAQYPTYTTLSDLKYLFYVSASSTYTNARQLVKGVDVRPALWSDINNDQGLSASISNREVYKLSVSASNLSASLSEYLPQFDVSSSLISSSLTASAALPIVAQYPTYFTLTGPNYVFYLSASSNISALSGSVRGGFLSSASWSDVSNDVSMSASVAAGEVYRLAVSSSWLSGSLSNYLPKFNLSSSFLSASVSSPILATFPTYYTLTGTNYLFYLSASSGRGGGNNTTSSITYVGVPTNISSSIGYIWTLNNTTSSVGYYASLSNPLSSVGYVNTMTNTTSSIGYVGTLTNISSSVNYVWTLTNATGSVNYVTSNTLNVVTASVSYFHSSSTISTQTTASFDFIVPAVVASTAGINVFRGIFTKIKLASGRVVAYNKEQW